MPINLVMGGSVMEGASGEVRMLPFAEDAWRQLLPDGEKLIPYLMKNDIPLYFMVDPDRHLVYHTSKYGLPPMDKYQRKLLEDVSWVSASAEELDGVQLHGSGLYEKKIAYLRLSKDSIEDLAHSGSCKAQSFAGCGLAKARSCRVVGHDRRGRPIKMMEEISTVEDLVKIEFSKAFIIDKDKWERAKRFGELGLRVDSPEFRADVMIRKEALYLDANDIARMKQDRLETSKRVAYPFRHQERMPGLYWMFQAAYMLNDLAELDGGAKGVEKWLKDNAPEKTYRYKSMRTAEKFVWPVVGRDQGGDERGEFDLEKINKLRGDGARPRYKLDFTSDGLAMILAIADSWYDLTEVKSNAAVSDLAQMLMANGFAGLEVGDLVYLIGGRRVDLAIESNLKTWVAKQNEMATKTGGEEMGWRDVIEQEVRERLLKKRGREETEREKMERERKGAN